MRVALLAALCFAVSGGTALACNDPSLGGVTSSAGPGDPVSFSAVHLDPGAAYSVTVGGRVVAAGTASDATVAGSFTMPDLGAGGTYYVELRVDHDGGTWVSTQPVRFVAPVAEPASKPQPRPRPRTAQPAPKVHAQAARPVAEPPATTPPATPPVSRPVPAAKPVRPRAHATERPTIRAPHVASASPRDAIPPEFALAPGRDRTALPLWLGLIALPATLGAVVAAVVRRRRMRARELAVEAELQEMVAEGRAGASAGRYLR